MLSKTFSSLPYSLMLLFITPAYAATELPTQTSYTPGIELPEGSGRTLISQVCTKCHDLKGLSAYKGYWNQERWSAMVEIMINHGADLNSEEADIISHYLAEHFGLNK